MCMTSGGFYEGIGYFLVLRGKVLAGKYGFVSYPWYKPTPQQE